MDLSSTAQHRCPGVKVPRAHFEWLLYMERPARLPLTRSGVALVPNSLSHFVRVLISNESSRESSID